MELIGLDKDSIKKKLLTGYILFSYNLYIDDDLIEKKEQLVKKEDVIYSSSSLIIALHDIQDNEVKLEIFNKDIYSVEYVSDNKPSHSIYSVLENGKIEKLLIQYRKKI